MCAKPQAGLGTYSVCHKPEWHTGECVYKSDAIVLLMAKSEFQQKTILAMDKRIAELESNINVQG